MNNQPKKYELSAWDLSELLPNTQEATIAARLSALEADVQKFVARRDQLNAEMEPALLVDTMQHGERILEQLYTLSAYGSLWFSADTQSPAALTPVMRSLGRRMAEWSTSAPSVEATAEQRR